MPEIVQDETVSESNPVKGEKLNGATIEQKEKKENGSEIKLAKNGHPEPCKESTADVKDVNNGKLGDSVQPDENSSATESSVDKKVEEDEKPNVDEEKRTNQTNESDNNSKIDDEDEKKEGGTERIEVLKKEIEAEVNKNKIEKTDQVEEPEEVEKLETVVDSKETDVDSSMKTVDVKEGESKSEISGTEIESSEEAVSSENEKLCEVTPDNSSCNVPETKEEDLDTNAVTDVKTVEAGVMEVEPTTCTNMTKETNLDEPTSAGGSKHSDSGIPEDIDSMITEGRACMAKNNYNGAADLLGKACEKLREMFGELDDRCAQCYYYYGSAMLECAKTENSVLGEGVNKEGSESEDEEIPMVKDKDQEEDDDTIDEVGEKKEEGGEKKDEVDEKKEEEDMKKEEKITIENVDNSKEAEPSLDEPMETDEKEESEEDVKCDEESNEENTDITLNKEEEEEEDTTLKAAWETLELAKFIFERQNNLKMLADTYFKLGEVAVESGHKTGFDDMKKCLEVRTALYSENHRAIPETHFNIGLLYSLFEMFDEAIEQFETSKDLLLKRIEMLEKTKEGESKNEINEIKGLLPDIDEKIKDMKESKEEKAKAEDTLKKKEDTENSSKTAEKTVSNLNHLVKRKRKIDEVAEALPEKDAKQACVEKETL